MIARILNELFSETRLIVMKVLQIIMAILLPPLGVAMAFGIGKQFWINVLLTILGYIPGIIHALIIIINGGR